MTQIQVQTVTVTATPPAPATFLKLGTIYNHAGSPFEVRFQAYTLDSTGKRVSAGYPIRSVSVTSGASTTLAATDNPTCDSKMEGLQVQLRMTGAEESEWQWWPGIHCTGDAKAYDFTLQSSTEIVMGANIQRTADPPHTPNITFNQDNSGHTLTIVSADAAADWASIQMTMNGAGCSVRLNGGANIASGSAVSTSSLKVSAGDVLRLSGSQGTACTMSLTYTTFNQLLGSWTFTF